MLSGVVFWQSQNAEWGPTQGPHSGAPLKKKIKTKITLRYEKTKTYIYVFINSYQLLIYN
jgi:hypothetical protein